jgi:hypothetical protein
MDLRSLYKQVMEPFDFLLSGQRPLFQKGDVATIRDITNDDPHSKYNGRTCQVQGIIVNEQNNTPYYIVEIDNNNSMIDDEDELEKAMLQVPLKCLDIYCDYNQLLQFDEYNTLIESTIQLLKEEPLTTSQIEFLTTRPWWSERFNKLNNYIQSFFTGTHIAAFPGECECLSFLNTIHFKSQGFRPIHFMASSQCHHNVRLLQKTIQQVYSNTSKVQVFTGFALCDDRIWRNHSWCYDIQSKEIIETCPNKPCLVYIGHDVTNIDWNH